MSDFTVAIPTYNGEKRLPNVLEKLRSQIHTEHISWEIIVIDNNSHDDTAKVVREYQATWSKAYPLKYYFEKQQGSAFARWRAAKEARSELIGFLDDDNLPAADWVAQAYSFGIEHPKAGAYGSRVFGDFEVTPPKNFHRIAPFFALTERGSQPRFYQPERRILPPAAGLVARQQAWLENVPSQPILKGGRTGDLLPGEDLEAVFHIQQAGWELWYNPAMQVAHQIPRWRLERDCLIHMFRCIGISRHVTRMMRFNPWQKPIAFLGYFGHDLYKLVRHLIKYRTQVKSDLVTACETAMFVYSLLGSFYLWRKILGASNLQSLLISQTSNLEKDLKLDHSEIV